MTDKKLTNDAIVKGLDGADVFLRDLAGATHTSLNEYDIGILFNIANLCGDAADIINRQKAHIDRLGAVIDSLRENICGLSEGLETAKAEAIKGFAERLKSVVAIHNGDMWSKYEYIDNLVKEMVGDSDA